MLKERMLYYYKTDEINGSTFLPLSPERTGLPVYIQIDNWSRFKYLEHPLWIYFKNSYDDRSNEWLPLVVSEKPYLPFPRKKVKITKEDFEKIVEFVSRYSSELRAVADDINELTITDFCKQLVVIFKRTTLQRML